MNSLEKSIGIILDLAYKRDEDNVVSLENLLEGPFRCFRQLMPCKLNLKRLLTKKIGEKFGEDVVLGVGARKPRHYKISTKYHFGGSIFVTPTKSKDLDNVEDLKHHLTGSAVCYRRGIILPYHCKYLPHGGIFAWNR